MSIFKKMYVKLDSMKWIGLTGGIATGKTTVARLIESRGYPVIDADKISHELSAPGQEGYEKIVSYFGNEILDSRLNINRKKLGEIVFEDLVQLKRLEEILHPLIKMKVDEYKNKYREQGRKIAFYDVPLLFEKDMQKNFDAVLVIWADDLTQLKRLMARNKLTKDEALLRIKAQYALCEKISRADFCIDNSGAEVDLIYMVDNLLTHLAGS